LKEEKICFFQKIDVFSSTLLGAQVVTGVGLEPIELFFPKRKSLPKERALLLLFAFSIKGHYIGTII
jgi:hypothetical protein